MLERNVKSVNFPSKKFPFTLNMSANNSAVDVQHLQGQERDCRQEAVAGPCLLRREGNARNQAGADVNSVLHVLHVVLFAV